MDVKDMTDEEIASDRKALGKRFADAPPSEGALIQKLHERMKALEDEQRRRATKGG